MGFRECKGEHDVWMRDCGDHYEYVACYVDDLIVASKNPQGIIDTLGEVYKFRFKGTGEINYHLGCDYFRDDEGTLCSAPLQYIARMNDSYVRIFGEEPKQKWSSPLEKNDHPELDTSELLDIEGIRIYMSMIGAAQWLVTLGRFDVQTAVMTLSSFRVAPRQGHLDRLKRVYGYVAKTSHACIRFRTDEPDYSSITINDHDWTHTIYRDAKEQLPHDAPKALGRRVVHTVYIDANLAHDYVTGKSCVGRLTFLNQTLVDHSSKKLATVETATYGSEFGAGKIGVQSIQDDRNTLRYLGVPIEERSYMFGDNQSVVTSSTVPGSVLGKRHHLLAFHFIREAIAAKYIAFIFLPGYLNPADIVSKHWAYADVADRLQAILYHQGDTAQLFDEDKHSTENETDNEEE